MTRRRLPLLLVLTFFVAASAYAHGFWYSAMSETDSFKSATESKVFKHAVHESAEGTHLHVKLSVDRGSVVVKLIDASGAVRLQKTCAAGTTKFDQQFAGKSGPWQVQLDFRGATGRYTVRLVDY